MKRLPHVAAILAAVLLVAGCEGQPSVEQKSKTVVDDISKSPSANAVPIENDTAKIIRRLAPEAAGIPAEIFAVYAVSPTSPKFDKVLETPDQGLTLAVMFMSGSYGLSRESFQKLYPDHYDEFHFLGDDGAPRANSIAQRLFSRTAILGYSTMLNPEHITAVTCKVDGDKAKGEISFVFPFFYQGKVLYVTQRTEGEWQIIQFEFPIHGWKFDRRKNGTWLLSRRHGFVGEPGKDDHYKVTGKVTLDGELLQGVSLLFFNDKHLAWRGRIYEFDGEFSYELPAGKYYIAVRQSHENSFKNIPDKVSNKYKQPHTSGLVIEVKKGENQIELNLTTDQSRPHKIIDPDEIDLDKLNVPDLEQILILGDEVLDLEKPNSVQTYVIRGIDWARKGELDKAIADYGEAIRLDPNYAKVFWARGNAWMEKGDLDKAIADYNEAIRLDPKDADPYYFRGNVWSNKGEFDKAIADFGEAIRLNPTDADAYLSRGFALGKKGEFDKTITDYTEAIRLSPKNAEAYFIRGLAWERIGSKAKAEADFKKAKELGHSP